MMVTANMQSYSGELKVGKPFVKEFDNLAMMYEWLRRQEIAQAAVFTRTCLVDYVDSRSPRI